MVFYPSFAGLLYRSLSSFWSMLFETRMKSSRVV